MTWHDWATLASIFMAGLFDGNGTVLRNAIPSKWEVWFKESGTTFTWIPSFLTNGTDGKIVYTTMPGDLDEIGEYQIQGMYANTNGDTFRSGIGRLAVRPSLTPVDARTLVLSGSLTAVHHTNNN